MDTATNETTLQGFITERNLDEADQEFPGIKQFYLAMTARVRTFLDLLRLFESRHLA